MAVFVRREEFLAGGYEMPRQANVDLSALGEQCVGQGVVGRGEGGLVGVGEVSGSGLDKGGIGRHRGQPLNYKIARFVILVRVYFNTKRPGA
jgi:hypothetical protein